METTRREMIKGTAAALVAGSLATATSLVQAHHHDEFTTKLGPRVTSGCPGKQGYLLLGTDDRACAYGLLQGKATSIFSSKKVMPAVRATPHSHHGYLKVELWSSKSTSWWFRDQDIDVVTWYYHFLPQSSHKWPGKAVDTFLEYKFHRYSDRWWWEGDHFCFDPYYRRRDLFDGRVLVSKRPPNRRLLTREELPATMVRHLRNVAVTSAWSTHFNPMVYNG